MNSGKALSTSQIRRFRQLGLDDKTLQDIAKQFEWATTSRGALLNKKVTSLNLENWTDLNARMALEQSVYRYTKKLIQGQDIGNMAKFMSDPMWGTVFHLRSFTLTAWENQFLYNIHMGDPAALLTFSYGVAWNAVVRALQLQLLSSTRSDAASFREKNMTTWELGKAGFQRAGFSSILPMLADTGLMMAGQPGMFNARTSAQASDAVFGNPTISMFDQAGKGIGGLADSFIHNRPMSQPEMRQLMGLFPGMNIPPVATGLSYMIRNMPEKAPKKHKPDY